MRFEGRLLKQGKWWAIEVPMLGVFTQGRSKREAYEMIKDAVELLADTPGFRVDVYPGVGRHFEVSASDERTLVALLLRRQRQARGLSLAEVTRRLGLKSRNAYARYEQGKAVPTVEKLTELLRAVNPERDLVLRQSA
jgi:hypothetical protein